MFTSMIKKNQEKIPVGKRIAVGHKSVADNILWRWKTILAEQTPSDTPQNRIEAKRVFANVASTSNQIPRTPITMVTRDGIENVYSLIYIYSYVFCAQDFNNDVTVFFLALFPERNLGNSPRSETNPVHQNKLANKSSTAVSFATKHVGYIKCRSLKYMLQVFTR